MEAPTARTTEKKMQAADASRQPAAAFVLSSHFQPIYSLAHRRAVGYEALIRARDPGGRAVSPAELFVHAPLGEARVAMDRRCRQLHVGNFSRIGDPRSWLFLNVDPYVAAYGRRWGSFFSEMLRASGFPPHRVAIELIESPLDNEERLGAALEYYRSLGCLIVIDDFGAGQSNFDRIWRLRPDIVKIDREMTRRVGVEAVARRMFTGIVSLLHEAGALVCVEGIETETEALCAVDANADLMQGYLFASPAEVLPSDDACRPIFERLFSGFQTEAGEYRQRRRDQLKPYLASLDAAVRSIAGGYPYERAAQPLLELGCTQRCYLLAGDGSQLGENLEAERNASARDARLEPMQPRGGTSWQTKPYFRRAVEAPGRIQITRPYLSVTGPRQCVTLSLAFVAEGGLRVLCADLDFAALAGADLSFGTSAVNEV
jgi:EAL domain-containing protein (putative c-di-GMP-specific phosphodiesterase class I)